jgi:signal transduction histidine kinase
VLSLDDLEPQNDPAGHRAGRHMSRPLEQVLGLAIVKEIMKAHGGEIDIADNCGGRAVFTLTFPLSPTSCDQSAIIRS